MEDAGLYRLLRHCFKKGTNMITEVWEVATGSSDEYWRVGDSVHAIELHSDGYGLAGYYDRIHIYFNRLDATDKIILPAWACGWKEEADAAV